MLAHEIKYTSSTSQNQALVDEKAGHQTRQKMTSSLLFKVSRNLRLQNDTVFLLTDSAGLCGRVNHGGLHWEKRETTPLSVLTRSINPRPMGREPMN